MKTINKITCFEYGILIYFVVRSMSLGISMDSYIHIGGVDGYLSPIIGTIVGIIPLFIFIKILNYKPELNIFEKVDFIFGKKIGILINLILTGTVFFLITMVFWNLLNFIGSQYLYRTSILYVAILFGICLIYTCTKKINVLARTSNILFYISLVIFLICSFGLIKSVNFSNLLPFLEFGIKNPLLSGLAHVCYSVLPLFILLLIPKNNIRNNRNLTKTIIFFYIFVNIGKFITILFTISTFGIDLAKIYEFPDFLLLRRISTTGFFQRFESILATQWIFDIFIMLSLCFNFIKYSYKHLISNKCENIFISIIIFSSCIICSKFLFKSNTVGDEFILYYLPYILAILLFIIPLIIFIKLKIKKT